MLAAVIGGCSKRDVPIAEPPLTVRQIIERSTDRLFLDQVDARNIAVGPDRAFDTLLGPKQGACYRASIVPALSNGTRRTVTFVAIADKGQIIDRRPAAFADHCEREPFEPVQRRPNEVSSPKS
jgi:hypothetical protein